MSNNTTADRNNLTDKELHYIKDFLSWELLAMKKYNQAANICIDPTIQTSLKQMGTKHQQHYNDLLNQLQIHS